MSALQTSLRRYKAIRKSVQLSSYGYWSVTYSVAPGIDLSILVATLGVTPDTAETLADYTLFTTTGQDVME